ncbi:hypothetical protein DAI22_09g140850 [Oryza sativa Japonica Group]|nr:hypothetical protein DAI22_09g140850 [Oryza sativa Japonica Group]
MASSRPQPTQFPSKRGGFASQMGSENRHGIAGHELSGSVGAHGGDRPRSWRDPRRRKKSRKEKY